jgi:hypothetical protein
VEDGDECMLCLPSKSRELLKLYGLTIGGGGTLEFLEDGKLMAVGWRWVCGVEGEVKGCMREDCRDHFWIQ